MAGKVEQWDFADEAANGSPGLINRQKSAGNLVVLAIDRWHRSGARLPFSREEYAVARKQGLEIVFEFEHERLDPLSRF